MLMKKTQQIILRFIFAVEIRIDINIFSPQELLAAHTHTHTEINDNVSIWLCFFTVVAVFTEQINRNEVNYSVVLYGNNLQNKN